MEVAGTALGCFSVRTGQGNSLCVRGSILTIRRNLSFYMRHIKYDMTPVTHMRHVSPILNIGELVSKSLAPFIPILELPLPQLS